MPVSRTTKDSLYSLDVVFQIFSSCSMGVFSTMTRSWAPSSAMEPVRYFWGITGLSRRAWTAAPTIRCWSASRS